MLGVFSEQDENSGHAGAGVGRVRSKADTHRPRGPARTPFGSSSGRKALGNITNTKQNSQRQSNLPQQKKAAVSFQLPASEPLPPLKPLAVQDSKPLQGQLDAGNQPAPPLLNQLDFRAQQLAEEGIEIRAGKGWYEQEAARELRIQQEIEARVNAICSRRLYIPTFMEQVLKLAVCCIASHDAVCMKALV